MKVEPLIGRSAIGLVVACVCVVLVTGTVLAVPGLRTRLGLVPAPPPRYEVGDRMGLPEGLFAGTSRTVFLFGRRTCGACQLAKPVLTGIASELKSETAVRVVLVSMGESASDALAFAEDLGISQKNLYQIHDTRIPVPYVPAVIVTDQSGKVLLTREGIPTDDDKQTILSVAASGHSASE